MRGSRREQHHGDSADTEGEVRGSHHGAHEEVGADQMARVLKSCTGVGRGVVAMLSPLLPVLSGAERARRSVVAAGA
jgi:hypothetical protein